MFAYYYCKSDQLIYKLEMFVFNRHYKKGIIKGHLRQNARREMNRNAAWSLGVSLADPLDELLWLLNASLQIIVMLFPKSPVEGDVTTATVAPLKCCGFK